MGDHCPGKNIIDSKNTIGVIYLQESPENSAIVLFELIWKFP